MRQVIVLSVALVAALIGAYVAWTDDEEPTDGDEAVAIYSAGLDDLAKLVWESKEHSVTVERKTDARGPYLWVTAVDRKYPKAKTVDPHEDEEEDEEEGEEEKEKAKEEEKEKAKEEEEEKEKEGEPEVAEPEPDPNVPIEEKTSAFLANKQGEELFETFAPLEAMRELPMATEDRETFGLAEDESAGSASQKPYATVTVERKNGAVALSVGGETYGSKDRYVEANGKVWLVDEGLLRPLEFAATRLVERSLFPTAEKDITKVEVQTPDGKVVGYVQANADDAAKAFWAKAEAPETEDGAAGTWLDKVFRLKLKEYADESKVGGPLEPVVSYTIHGAGETTRVEILKSALGEESSWYARSDYNRVLVSLTDSLARNVVDDVPTLTEK